MAWKHQRTKEAFPSKPRFQEGISTVSNCNSLKSHEFPKNILQIQVNFHEILIEILTLNSQKLHPYEIFYLFPSPDGLPNITTIRKKDPRRGGTSRAIAGMPSLFHSCHGDATCRETMMDISIIGEKIGDLYGWEIVYKNQDTYVFMYYIFIMLSLDVKPDCLDKEQ